MPQIIVPDMEWDMVVLLKNIVNNASPVSIVYIDSFATNIKYTGVAPRPD